MISLLLGVLRSEAMVCDVITAGDVSWFKISEARSIWASCAVFIVLIGAPCKERLSGFQARVFILGDGRCNDADSCG